MNLEKKVKSWQKKGLITPQQGKLIIAHEKRQAKPYLFYGFLTIAFFCIGLGLVSIIAANWAVIPSSVKLMFDFILLTAIAGYAFISYRNGKISLFDGLVCLFALAVLASIGLFLQIYQLQPEDLSVFLLWSLLLLPLTLFNKSMLLPAIVLPALWMSLFDFAMQKEGFQLFLQTLTDAWEYSGGLIFLFAGFLLYQLLRLLCRGKAAGFTKALRFWLVLETVVAVFFMDFERNFLLTSLMPYHVEGLLGAVLVLIAAVMIAVSFYLENRRHRPFYIPFLMLIIFIGGLLPLSFVLSFALLILAGIYAYHNHFWRLFNLVFVLAALRIFLIYVDFWGSLMQTEIGLIVSGVVLLLLLLASSKLGKYLQKGKVK